MVTIDINRNERIMSVSLIIVQQGQLNDLPSFVRIKLKPIVFLFFDDQYVYIPMLDVIRWHIYRMCQC